MYSFLKVQHEKSAQTGFSIGMWVSILKGLKLLNTVLNKRKRKNLISWKNVDKGKGGCPNMDKKKIP